MKRFFILLIITILWSCNNESSPSQEVEVSNSSLSIVEPPNWWVGMNESSLQLLVHHDKIGSYTPTISYPGVTIDKVHKAKSPNYLFIDLTVATDAAAGKFDIVFNNDDGQLNHTYELKARVQSGEEFSGFDSSDVVFLITPDRFANGDTSNDVVETLNEKHIDRSDHYGRHGGDIQGIINHLDYISDLGYTAIWSCPLLTNDMFQSSYHGYAITDLYEIDPRFGTNETYVELSAKMKEKGMKLVMDQVANHCGLEHWWMKDLPFDDWVNDQANFEANKENWGNDVVNRSNHRRTTNQDIYASKSDSKGMSDGWFVPAMPDLNQRNPFMAKYIIQNSIWWIETADLGGIRQDTYPYPDKQFMSDWAGAIMNEYPNFSIVGEEWSYNPLLIAYWQEGADNHDGYDSNLRSSMDFAMQQRITDALNEAESWDKGLVKIYEGLANDFAYPSPKDIMIFPDNHDMSRIFTQLAGDIPNTKMALATHASLPRIPQIYYGTEILMHDFEKPGDHGLIRSDFPGGWDGDQINAFTGEGLTDEQKDMQSFVKALLNYRKSSKAIHEGETVHFSPFLGTYFLFRMLDDEVVVLMLNKNEEPISIDLKRYAEIGLEGKTLRNVITGDTFTWGDVITFESRGVTLLTTKQ